MTPWNRRNMSSLDLISVRLKFRLRLRDGVGLQMTFVFCGCGCIDQASLDQHATRILAGVMPAVDRRSRGARSKCLWGILSWNTRGPRERGGTLKARLQIASFIFYFKLTTPCSFAEEFNTISCPDTLAGLPEPHCGSVLGVPVTISR